MIGTTNLGGSGGGKAYAAISVTYPVGSVCTCSNGSKTLKAKDTSGSFLFLVPSGGEWTVSCTDGEKSSSKTLTVEEKGTYSMSLAYELYIIQNGQPLYAMTSLPTTQYQLKDGYIQMGTGSQGWSIGVRTTDMIDCTGYSYLCGLGCYWGDRTNITGSTALFDEDGQVLARTEMPRVPSAGTPIFSDIVRVPINGSSFKLGVITENNNWSDLWIKDLWLE